MGTSVRIVERTHVDGQKSYVIQQRHFLFRWIWVDARLNSWDVAVCCDNFSTLSKAREHLCYFDGSKPVDTAVKEDT